MNVCDIGVLTSNINLHGEGISNALMEFCALGIPVLATNNGGTPEIIEEGTNGYLLEPFDEIGLTKKIEDLISDDEKRIRMGASAKKIVMEKFSIQQMVEKFYSVFKEV